MPTVDYFLQTSRITFDHVKDNWVDGSYIKIEASAVVQQ